MTRHITRALTALFALAILCAPLTAGAHAALITASPADGALLADPPARVVLTFTEAVAPLAMTLIGPDGAMRDLPTTGGADLTVAIDLPDLARGSHVLSWRVVSQDGHPIAGGLVFSIGAVTGATGAPSSDRMAAFLLWGAKLGMAAGLIAGVGGALFGAVAGLPPGAARPIARLTACGMAMAVLALGLQGVDALGLSPGELANPSAWRAGWSTGYGATTLLALFSGGAALAGLTRPAVAVVGVAALAAAYAATGHAATADPQWLMRPAVALHLAALVFWLGALLPLAIWLARMDGAAALARFSDAIPLAAILLVGSGAALVLVQTGDLLGLSTAYGRILTAKLALVAAMFALAAHNRWRLTGPALRGDRTAARRLRRAVIIEIVLALAILGLAAGWRFTPPPRALAQAAVAAPPAYAHIHGAGVMADVTVARGPDGLAAAEIALVDAEMRPVAPLAVTLGMALPDRGVARIARPAEIDAAGLWRVKGLAPPLPGEWIVDLEIRLSRFSMVRIEGVIAID